MKNKRHWHVIIEQLRNIPHAVGAEIGVHKGLFASRLLKNLPNIQKYYCVDPWEFYDDYKKTLRKISPEYKTPKAQIYRVFLRNTSPWQHKRIIIRAKSMDALDQIEDNSLDWVFIDACHSYEHARPDIIGWSKKVKVGGLVSGHDFKNAPSPHRKIQFGVGRAVRELIPEFKVEANTWYTIKQSDNWIKE